MNTIRSAAVLVLAALLATACSGGDDEAAPVNTVAPAESTTSTTSTTTTTSTTSTTTTTTTSTTTTTTLAEGTDEEQIETLIETYWRTALVEAFDPPNPADDTWSSIATPSLNALLDENEQQSLDANQGVAGTDPDVPFVLSSQITIIEPLAIIFMCLRDEGTVYDLATGDTKEEISIITLKRMEAVNGPAGWLIDSSESVERFTNDEEDACAEAFP